MQAVKACGKAALVLKVGGRSVKVPRKEHSHGGYLDLNPWASLGCRP